MATSRGNEDCSPEFAEKADNLDKQMNAIESRLEELEKLMEDITIALVKLESSYSPQELGKTEEELKLRDVQLLRTWQGLKNIETSFRTADVTLRDVYRSITKVKSDMVSEQRQERSSEQDFQQVINKTKKNIETDDESEDPPGWNRELSENLNREIIVGLEKFRRESLMNQRILHEKKSKREKLKKRADAVKKTSQDLARRTDVLQRPVEQERQAVQQELRRIRGQFRICETLPQEMAAPTVVTLASAAAITEVERHETEEESRRPAEERPEIENEKTESEKTEKVEQSPKTRKS